MYYRWRNDTDTEGSSTFLAATNTPVSGVNKNSNIRLRIEVSNEGTVEPTASSAFRIEYAPKSGTCSSTSGWTTIPSVAASEHWQMTPSSYFFDNDPTTNVLDQNGQNALPDAEPTFKAGYLKESSSTASLLTVGVDYFTELEYAIKATSNATSGNTYCFRLTDNGTALPSYVSSAYPEATIATGAVSGTLISAIFDTRNAKGASLNSIIWHGFNPAGASVKFQIAAATSSGGPWVYKGSDGSSCTASIYYTPTGSGLPLAVDRTCHNNYRYYRYKVILWSTDDQSASPRVDDIVLNWSP
ncbi:MAG: hypothetical protein A2939_05815 [Parcubacteria group bacterium RIFCSPLOWO2_01_FULL_48_18]|nr:MAG: hypothetical protein A2939_05815 [Parcubacteria group bacterium RIFCSPLOWO2_01_FULL_48_18]